MGSAAKRRKSGCWTCRLRRKKCEEGGPPCLTCVSRHIHCHGYGPKPEWKDKGEKERQEAIRLRIISSRSPAAHVEVSQGRLSPASSPAAAENVQAISHATDNVLGISTSQGNGNSDIDFALEGELDFMKIADLDHMIFLSDQWRYIDSELDLTSTPMDQEQPMNKYTENNTLQRTCLSITTSEHRLDHQSSEREMDLVMHYVDYSSNREQEFGGEVFGPSKGWLLLTLMRSPAMYNAALSLSAYHQHLKAIDGNESGSTAYHDYEKYRLRARQIFECLQPDFPGENLICAVELARLEALGGNWEKSRDYLQCAMTLLQEPHMQDQAVEYTDSSKNTGLTTPTSPTCFSTGTVVARQAPLLPSDTERKALSYSQALLAWIDVLTCSAQRLVPGFHETYRCLLSNSDFCFSFQAVTSCESWVLQIIMDVVLLDAWKRDQETRRDLSIRDLVKRADEIASTIERRARSLGATRGLHEKPSLGLSAQHDGLPGQSMTLLYAHAALVYLNFIVSGPNSGAREIRQSIDLAITVWKSVPLYNGYRLLVWPLLITAKLAQGQQREFFRNLMESCPEIRAAGNHYDIWSVVTTCWEEGDQQIGAEQTRMNDWGNKSQEHELGILIA
ncbi:PRO1A C6 zink-finger protein [Colletotrichum cereale]|nr:PRO1A C6 zink-finger protein [Colletotrichum cereale]